MLPRRVHGQIRCGVPLRQNSSQPKQYFLWKPLPDCADGSKVIFYVVDTWDADFVHMQHWGNTVAVVHGKRVPSSAR